MAAIHLAPCAFGEAARVPVRVSLRSVRGLHLWWSLPALFDFLSVKEGATWGAVRRKMWQSWKTMIDEADFGTDDLLGAPIDKRSGNAAKASPTCEWWPAASTRGLLLLLCRWCSAGSQTGRVDFLADSSRDLLELLLGSLDVDLCVAGESVETPTDRTISGERLVHMPVQNGVADLAFLKSTQREDMVEFLPGLVSDDAAIDVVSVLLAAPRLTRKLNKDFGYLAQMIWQLGPAVEQRVLAVDVATLEEENWPAASALDLETLDFAARQRAGKMYSYQKACFSEANAAVMLGIAVDDGRVAREPWKLGAFLRPDTGFAGWMAPKARAQRGAFKASFQFLLNMSLGLVNLVLWVY